MRIARLLPIFLTATIAVAAAQSAPDWTAITAAINKAADNGDAAGLKTGRAAALRFVAAPTATVPAAVARYTVAYVDCRLAFEPGVSAAEGAGFLNEAETQLQRAIQADPKFAEAHALLSSVYGLKIAQAPESGMTLGPQSM